MKSYGFKSFFKSPSLGNLSTIDDNSNDVDETPHTAHIFSRGDKQNLSSINEQKRELHQKLKEFTDVRHRSIEYEFDLDFQYSLPARNCIRLQENVSKEVYQQQSAMLELLITEQNFLKQIQFIVKVCITVFEKIMKEFLPKINANDIFSNLKDVYRVSIDFWKQCMQPVIDGPTNTHQPLQSRLMKPGFIKIGDILEPYITYCTEVSTCRSYISSLEKGNELFSEYTKWVMEFEESNRETLCDQLAKPFQRLTKYKILLRAIYKYSNENEKSDIQEMIDAVDTFMIQVNEKVEEKSLMKKLVNLSKQIDSYDVIDQIGEDVLSLIKPFNTFDLNTPIMIGERKIIRQVYHQGEVRLREGLSKTIEVKLYLFTDILLVTKHKKRTFGRMKIIKPPIILNKLEFRKLPNNSFVCICLNEFDCISSLYQFICSDTKKVDEWLHKLGDTMNHYSALKQSQKVTHTPLDIHDSTPLVNEVQPCHQLNFPKQLPINGPIETDSFVESNFKRKSPVERKHKNKKCTLCTVEFPVASSSLQSKNSYATYNITSVNHTRKLSKSNSFHEREKQFVDALSDNSDVDSAPNSFDERVKTLPVSLSIEKGISDDFAIYDKRKSCMSKLHKSLTPSEILQKNFSNSLGKLTD